MFRSLGPHARGQLLDLVQRFAPQRVDVGVLARDGDRRVGRAAEIDRHVRLLERLDLREPVLETVVLAFVVERAIAGPDATHDVQVFVGTLVALVVAQPVAVAALFVVGTARDEVHTETAATELVQRRDLTCRERGLGEAWAVREHEVHALGVRGGVGDGKRRARAGGVVWHQHAVEARSLVRLREGLDIVAIDHGPTRGMGFGNLLRLDHADEFDAHSRTPC